MLFSTAAVVALVIIWPQYLKRQRRLEMQFQAQQEIVRRRAAGEPRARPAGSEGDAPPPAHGELIIPIWPLAVFALAVGVTSAVMFWRAQVLASRPSGRGGES
jgi:hypothetical protein